MRPALIASLALLVAPISQIAPAAHAASQPPRDTCTRLPVYTQLRARLVTIVESRAKDDLLDLLSTDILNSFGGDGGKAEFVQTWHLDHDPGSSPVWDHLAAMLKLGCFASDNDMSMPYFFEAPLPPERADADVFTLHLVTGTSVALRDAPSAQGKVLARLDWTLVDTIDEWSEDARWRQVRLGNGRTGFIRSDYLRSQVDYRAIFRRVDGQWQMTALVAGD